MWSVNGPRILQLGYEDEEDPPTMEAFERVGALVRQQSSECLSMVGFQMRQNSTMHRTVLTLIEPHASVQSLEGCLESRHAQLSRGLTAITGTRSPIEAVELDLGHVFSGAAQHKCTIQQYMTLPNVPIQCLFVQLVEVGSEGVENEES